MCFLHATLAKKFKESLEEISSRVTSEVGDSDYFNIKAIRLKAIDQFTSIKGCQSAERFLKLLNLPVPDKRDIPAVQNYLTSIIQGFQH